ncbi:trypco2 family protein, partial [Streptomyces sp. NPDC001274]
MTTIGLAAAIEELRQELYQAQAQGCQQQFAFLVIRKHEEEVHTGLLGSSTDTIDLEFGFLPSP